MRVAKTSTKHDSEATTVPISANFLPESPRQNFSPRQTPRRPSEVVKRRYGFPSVLFKGAFFIVVVGLVALSLSFFQQEASQQKDADLEFQPQMLDIVWPNRDESRKNLLVIGVEQYRNEIKQWNGDGNTVFVTSLLSSLSLKMSKLLPWEEVSRAIDVRPGISRHFILQTCWDRVICNSSALVDPYLQRATERLWGTLRAGNCDHLAPAWLYLNASCENMTVPSESSSKSFPIPPACLLSLSPLSDTEERKKVMAELVKVHPGARGLFLPLPYLRQMATAYGSEQRQFIFHSQHGLGNRLQGLSSAVALAGDGKRRLRVVWEKDKHCGAGFSDLFQNNFDVWDSFHHEEVSIGGFDLYNYMDHEEGAEPGKRIVLDTDRHVYVKASGWPLEPRPKNSLKAQILQSLVPSEAVLSLMSRLRVNATELGKMVGVHIRSLMPNQEIDEAEYSERWLETAQSAREKTTVHVFEKIIARVIERRPRQRFFVCADTAVALNRLAEVFGDNVVVLEVPVCSDRAVQCMQRALADMMLLSRTRVLLGSAESSFTIMAAAFRKIPLFIAKDDLSAVDRIDRALPKKMFRTSRVLADDQ